MKLLVIDGPDLDQLGTQNPDPRPEESYGALVAFVEGICEAQWISVEVFQSNSEEAIVGKIREAKDVCDGIVINPSTLARTGVAVMDALKEANIPAVEVHLTDVGEGESYPGKACIKTYADMGFEGYRQALMYLKDYLMAN